jgi:hypothetical protein
VINSANLLLKNKLPMLFFECQYEDIVQMEIQTLINHLAERGYKNWTIFDNFGALMLRNGVKHDILD